MGCTPNVPHQILLTLLYEVGTTFRWGLMLSSLSQTTHYNLTLRQIPACYYYHNQSFYSSIHFSRIVTSISGVVITMSIYRWSLPGRALARGGSDRNSSDQPEKFSTVHIGQSKHRRRGNLSSVFSTLLEKEENYQETGAIGTSLPTTSGQAPPSSRTENAISTSSLRLSHVQESQSINPFYTNDTQYNGIFRPTVAHPEGSMHGGDAPFVPMPGAVGTLRYQLDEVLQKKEHDGFKNDEAAHRSRDLGNHLALRKPNMFIERARSRSSSYPSEGIRSPATSPHSPEPTASTKALIAELVRHGSVPRRMTLLQSDVSGSHSSWPNQESGQSPAEELVAVKGVSDAINSNIGKGDNATDCICAGVISTATSNKSGTPGYLLESWSSEHRGQGARCLRAFPKRKCNDQVIGSQATNPQSEIPALHPPVVIGTSTSKQNEGSQESSNSHNTGITGLSAEVAEDDPDMMHTGHREYTVDTIRTLSSLHPDPTPEVNGRNSLEIPILYKIPLPDRNSSSTTLAQRIQRFKLKKWVKRVYKRSKARFRHTAKPMPPLTISHRYKDAKPRGNKKHHKHAGYERKIRTSAGTFGARAKGQKKKGGLGKKTPKQSWRATTAIKKGGSIMSMPLLRFGEKRGMSRSDFRHHKRAVSCPG